MKKIFNLCAVILTSIALFCSSGYFIARYLDNIDKDISAQFDNYFANQDWLSTAYQKLEQSWESATWDRQGDFPLDPYDGEVTSSEQLAGALFGNGGGDTNIILQNDIDLSNYLCNPIGRGDGTVKIDGQGYSITGINIIFDPGYIYDRHGYDVAREYVHDAIGNELYKNGIGLFATLNDATQIVNVTFCGCIIFPATIPETLEMLGYTLEDVFGNNDVYVGGLAGHINSDIATVGADFGIYFNVDCNAIIGGLAGEGNYAAGCYSTSYIRRDPSMESESMQSDEIYAHSTIGGLFGYSSGWIEHSYNSSGVYLKTSDETSLVGGIVGDGGATITSCYSLYDRIVISDSSSTPSAGGLAGNAGEIKGCLSMPAYWSAGADSNIQPLAVSSSLIEQCVWLDEHSPGDGSDEENYNGMTSEELRVAWENAGSAAAGFNPDWYDFYTNLFTYGNMYSSAEEIWFGNNVNKDNIGISPQGYPGLNWNNYNSGGGGGTVNPDPTPNPNPGGGTTTTYYYITYDGNGGTTNSGSTTLSQRVAKNGSFTTKSSTEFKKSGYKIVNWSTSKTSLSGSYPKVNTSYTYTEGKDITLYAIWEVDNDFDVYMRIYTDANGTGVYKLDKAQVLAMVESYSASYWKNDNGTATEKTITKNSDADCYFSVRGLVDKAFKFTYIVKDGYQFVGYTKTMEPETSASVDTSSRFFPTTTMSVKSYSLSFTPSGSVSSRFTYLYVFVSKAPSSNQLKYDSTEKYFYFEDGYFPQSYVGDTLNTTLKNASSSSLSKYQTLNYLGSNGTEQAVDIYTYNSKKYAKVVKNGVIKWFSVEAIRWRVSEYDVSSTAYPSTWTKGSVITNFKVVSDRVLWVGAITTEATKESWKYTSSEMYNYVSNIYTKNGQTLTADKPQYVATSNETFYYYGETGQQNKVKEERKSISNINVATESEIKEHLTSLKAKASDLVAFLLGLDEDSYCDYWTRELGGSLQNAKAVTNAGVLKSAWLSNFYGVRFSLCMSEGSRV